MLQLAPQDVQGPSFVASATGSKKKRSSEVQGESSPLEFLLMKTWHKKPLTCKTEEQRPMFEEARRNGKIAAYFVSEGWLLKRELASQLSSCVVLMCFSIL